MQAILDAQPDWQPGDVYAVNDPYRGGTHLPDITLAAPIFRTSGKRQGPPVAFVVNRAHHADIGGSSPGSMPIATEIYQEGLIIPPVRFARNGQIDPNLLAILQANVRTPTERLGDLRAQMAALNIGSQRFLDLQKRYGHATLQDHMQDLCRYGKKLMTATIRRIPNGIYRFTDTLDNDGIDNTPLPIEVTLTIKGGRATVDFSGSAPACPGSINAVPAITMSAVYYAFLCLMVSPESPDKRPMADPPFNAGCLDPIRFILPPHSIVNADPPHAVSGGNVETSQRIVDVVFGALAKALPNRIPAASQGTMNNLTLGGTAPDGRPFAYYETMGGGMGARPGLDGCDAIHTHMTNTLNTPIEAMESAYPVRVEHYGIARQQPAQGSTRGGRGIRRDIRLLTDARGSILSERRTTQPYGLHEGQPGPSGKNTLIRNGRHHPLPAKTPLELEAGDVLSIQTPGGGGWGKHE
jgi:N-methylhydantoinase B